MAVISMEDRSVPMSVRRLADAFEVSRETVSRRLAARNVLSCGMRNGHPVYRLRDAAPAIIAPSLGADGELDPSKLPPMERNAWYQSELRRIDLGLKSQQLIPAAQFEAELADMAKDLVQYLETLADQLERDAGLTPEQIEALQESIDRQRHDLHARLTDAGEDVEPQAVQTGGGA
jgi:hypothetical protein